MKDLTRQTRTELRQLPMMLCKLLGGLAAVFGFAATVMIATRNPNASLLDVLSPLLLTCSGIVAFILSNRRLARRSSVAAEKTQPADKRRMSALSWLLFLLFAGIFILCVYFITG